MPLGISGKLEHHGPFPEEGTAVKSVQEILSSAAVLDLSALTQRPANCHGLAWQGVQCETEIKALAMPEVWPKTRRPAAQQGPCPISNKNFSKFPHPHNCQKPVSSLALLCHIPGIATCVLQAENTGSTPRNPLASAASLAISLQRSLQHPHCMLLANRKPTLSLQICGHVPA